MAGALRKTFEYLGLAEADERYYDDQYDAYDGDAGRGETAEQPRSSHQTHSAEVTPLPQRTPVARIVRDPESGQLNRITTIHPRTYNDAKNIGEAFRDNVPVIMNLSDMDDSDAKRLVDFAAGLVFGLHGSIERVTNKVFLLSPEYVEVEGGTGAEPNTAARGLFNQS